MEHPCIYFTFITYYIISNEENPIYIIVFITLLNSENRILLYIRYISYCELNTWIQQLYIDFFFLYVFFWSSSPHLQRLLVPNISINSNPSSSSPYSHYHLLIITISSSTASTLSTSLHQFFKTAHLHHYIYLYHCTISSFISTSLIKFSSPTSHHHLYPYLNNPPWPTITPSLKDLWTKQWFKHKYNHL